MHGSFAPTQCSSHSPHSRLLEDYYDILLASRLSNWLLINTDQFCRVKWWIGREHNRYMYVTLHRLTNTLLEHADLTRAGSCLLSPWGLFPHAGIISQEINMRCHTGKYGSFVSIRASSEGCNRPQRLSCWATGNIGSQWEAMEERPRMRRRKKRKTRKQKRP
ncbi:hypothetical protein M431DRAFT_436109 [Trichoderma harzianum CBS 226.95]|uniref:Uncharacterized protein n=1 Tax=Trichoderma harzianum CBS 226.95 TaxID=983964 RepID=A0A2T4AD59_TRIHA|nr:hypothetical protein M431DRAFT_436109 [Trichoderma harzianum CBS 226.95]PTB55024.1 hypothetical protein M431DRAFT_436109 [Trichoderma harzianum CBS 226.95]